MKYKVKVIAVQLRGSKLANFGDIVDSSEIDNIDLLVNGNYIEECSDEELDPVEPLEGTEPTKELEPLEGTEPTKELEPLEGTEPTSVEGSKEQIIKPTPVKAGVKK